MRTLTEADRIGQRAGSKAPNHDRSPVISCSSADGDKMVDDRNRRAAMARGSAIRIAPHTNAKAHSKTVSNVSSDMNNTMTPAKTVEVTRSSQGLFGRRT